MKWGTSLLILFLALIGLILLSLFFPKFSLKFPDLKEKGSDLINSEKINIEWWKTVQDNFSHRWQDSIKELHDDRTIKSIQKFLSLKVWKEIKNASEEKLQNLQNL